MRYYSSWRRHQAKENVRSLFSVFLTIVILFAIVSGLSKGFLLSSKLHSARWDGKSPITVALGAKNSAVFIFQPDIGKMTVLSLDSQVLYDSGESAQPLKAISDATGVEVAKVLSKAFGAKIENFVSVGESVIDYNQAQKFFKNFASLATPLWLLTTGYKTGVEETNITRLDALRLWWQLKSLSTKDIVFADLSAESSVILDQSGQRVLGADTDQLNREISTYLQNLHILEDNFSIMIRNLSGSSPAARLAANFVAAEGGHVVNVASANSTSPKSAIIAPGSSYTASYLAKMFNCDINVAQNTQDSREITIEIGQDFANSYF